jgi:hypothetical protein
MKLLLLLFFLFLTFTINNELSSQVTIVPQILFLDPDSKSGSIEVINPSNEVREFNITFKFGVNKYDSLGALRLSYDDTVMENQFSILPYLKYFPKNLVIPGRETQTVRFNVVNLPENTNKTYWARIIVNSEPLTPQIDTSTYTEPGKIRSSVILKTQMNGIVAFNHGNVTSVVDLDFYRFYKDSSNSHFLFKYTKGGTSPFLGVMFVKIYDINNNVLLENNLNIAFYEPSTVDFKVSSKQLTTGKLKFEVTVNNNRDNIPEEMWIPFKEIKKTFEVEYK